MDAREFVQNFRKLKDELLLLYMSEEESSAVGILMGKMDLDPEQRVIMKSVVDGILTDTCYSILLGLDGSASIGNVQMDYRIHDEDGNLISECGEIEAEAWEQFQNE